MTAMTAAERLALADRLFASIEAGNIDGVAACYAPGVAIWHNFDQATQGAQENLQTLGWLVRHLGDIRYEIVRRDVVDDAVWQQHVLHGTVVATGVPFRLPAAMLLTMAQGQITRIDEYLDAAATGALAGGR